MLLQPPETDLPRGGGKLYWVQGDVSEPGTWERVQNLARSDLEGAVTVLVSCAMQHAMGDILTLSDADWASVFRSTFYGAVLAIRSCLPTMIEVGGGSIVTVGSVSGQFAEQGLVAYGAAKAALIQLTRSVAVDFGEKVSGPIACAQGLPTHRASAVIWTRPLGQTSSWRQGSTAILSGGY